MQELEVVFNALPPAALSRFVVDNLDNHNVAATGLSTWYPVGFFLKNARGEWLGGLLGLWGGWLQSESSGWTRLRAARGNGTRLLQAVEKYGVERGCIAAPLETHSFQARPFYENGGYQTFGMLKDYPPGHAKFFMQKRLAEAPS